MNYIDMHCDTLAKAVEQKKETAKNWNIRWWMQKGCTGVAQKHSFLPCFYSRKRRKLE